MSRQLTELITAARQNRLDHVEILDKYSMQELSEIYNGIGPDRFPEKLRAFVTSLNDIFEPAALIHDVEYHEGGSKADFSAANTRFRTNCALLVDNAYAWYDPRRYYWEFKAWRFAGYCEQFGWEGYHKTEAEP